VHGDKYDYSKVEYVNNENKVFIICPEHGEFLQTPHSHLSGCGCKKCGIESRIEKLKSTKETFIKKASFVHDNIYNYSLIKDYKNGKQKIPIIGKKHGVFYQRAEDHLQGHGCSCCVTSSIENEISKFLKDNDIQFIQQYRNKNILGKLSLDFYLPDYNIAIECQGLQHFKPVNFSNKNNENIYENFEKQIDRDKEKHNLCEQNGIRLLYFSNLDIIYPYKVYTNKEELLTEIKNG
jgi:very-short-patch-repair endonuclease